MTKGLIVVHCLESDTANHIQITWGNGVPIVANIVVSF